MSLLNLALILIATAGAFNAGSTPSGHSNSGRIGGIAIDPSDPSGNTVFVGSANGGVWKTTNGGN